MPATSADTTNATIKSAAETPTELPSLPFSLRDHKISIAVFWSLIATEVCFIPISFYYGLWYGTSLNHGALFAIITSVFGIVSGLEFALRTFQLARPDPRYRPAGGSRWHFDATQITLTIPYTVMTFILVGFSIPYEPIVRGLATPFACADIILGAIFLWSAWAHTRGWRTPFRLSSTLKGDPCPPFAFVVLEDVVTVDGGCPGFRVAVQKRWAASPVFRQLLVQLTWAWGASSFIVGVAVLIVVGTVEQTVAYGVGWAVPSLHAGIGALASFYWAKRMVLREATTFRNMHCTDSK